MVDPHPAQAVAGTPRRRSWRGFLLGAATAVAAIAAADRLNWVRVTVHGDPLGFVRDALEPAGAGRSGNTLIGFSEANASPPPAGYAAAAPSTAGPAVVDGAVSEQVQSLLLLTSAAMLDDAVQTSRPYISELALAFKVADGDPVLLAPLDRLMPWAETGATNTDELARRFAALARQIRAVNTQAEAVGWMMRGARLLTRDLPSLLGVSETSRPDWQRALERATAAVEHGTLGEAARTLTELGEPTIGLVQPWVASVDVRLAIESEVRRFRREAVERALGDAG